MNILPRRLVSSGRQRLSNTAFQVLIQQAVGTFCLLTSLITKCLAHGVWFPPQEKSHKAGWAQAETPALPVTLAPLQPRDETGLHVASLLLLLGSPGNVGQRP